MALRLRQRREVRETLRHGQPTSVRSPLSAEAAYQLFCAVDSKLSNAFGLVKLAALDLDALHAAPVRRYEHDVPLTVWAPTITLLAYAAHRCQDGIIGSLLRAGADPSVRCCINGGDLMTPGVREYVASLRPAYAVWLVRLVVAMRRAGAVAVNDGSAGCCQLCGEGSFLCTSPLAWPGCAHLLCESCFWRRHQAHNHVECGGDEMPCPLCPESGCKDTAVTWLSPACCSTAAERAERKAASERKWRELPRTDAEAEQQEAGKNSTKQKKPKGVRIPAMPEREAAGMNPGYLQAQRVERLNEAACADDVMRLIALIDAGVDVDGTNECGETAALSAAMLGNAKSLRLLAWAGADLRMADHAGATPTSAATARGHETVLSALREYLPEICCKKPIASPSSQFESVLPCQRFQRLIDPTDHPEHPGAGSGYVDGGFSAAWMDRLDQLWASLPTRAKDAASDDRSFANTCATRSFFCDAEAWVTAELAPLAEQLLRHSGVTSQMKLVVLPRMRFLCYSEPGGDMQPHVDLAKRDPCPEAGSWQGRPSTHTFMVHLADCQQGGETVLLRRLGAVTAVRGSMEPGRAEPDGAATDATSAASGGCDGGFGSGVLAAVSPVRGRLLIFPHLCPHAGLPVVDAPKVFLRGELRWDPKVADPYAAGCNYDDL